MLTLSRLRLWFMTLRWYTRMETNVCCHLDILDLVVHLQYWSLAMVGLSMITALFNCAEAVLSKHHLAVNCGKPALFLLTTACEFNHSFLSSESKMKHSFSHWTENLSAIEIRFVNYSDPIDGCIQSKGEGYVPWGVQKVRTCVMISLIDCINSVALDSQWQRSLKPYYRYRRQWNLTGFQLY